MSRFLAYIEIFVSFVTHLEILYVKLVKLYIVFIVALYEYLWLVFDKILLKIKKLNFKNIFFFKTYMAI